MHKTTFKTTRNSKRRDKAETLRRKQVRAMKFQVPAEALAEREALLQ